MTNPATAAKDDSRKGIIHFPRILSAVLFWGTFKHVAARREAPRTASTGHLDSIPRLLTLLGARGWRRRLRESRERKQLSTRRCSPPLLLTCNVDPDVRRALGKNGVAFWPGRPGPFLSQVTIISSSLKGTPTLLPPSRTTRSFHQALCLAIPSHSFFPRSLFCCTADFSALFTFTFRLTLHSLYYSPLSAPKLLPSFPGSYAMAPSQSFLASRAKLLCGFMTLFSLANALPKLEAAEALGPRDPRVLETTWELPVTTSYSSSIPSVQSPSSSVTASAETTGVSCLFAVF